MLSLFCIRGLVFVPCRPSPTDLAVRARLEIRIDVIEEAHDIMTFAFVPKDGMTLSLDADTFLRPLVTTSRNAS